MTLLERRKTFISPGGLALEQGKQNPRASNSTHGGREREHSHCASQVVQQSGFGVAEHFFSDGILDGVRGALDPALHGGPRRARRQVPQACVQDQGAVRQAQGCVGQPRQTLRQLEHGQEQRQVPAGPQAQPLGGPQRPLRGPHYRRFSLFVSASPALGLEYALMQVLNE